MGIDVLMPQPPDTGLDYPPRSARVIDPLAPIVYQEMTQNEEAALTANAKATTAGQAADDDAAADVNYDGGVAAVVDQVGW